MSEEAENWCPTTIWPNVGCGVCPNFPKKVWAGLLCIRPAQTFLENRKIPMGLWAKTWVHAIFISLLDSFNIWPPLRSYTDRANSNQSFRTFKASEGWSYTEGIKHLHAFFKLSVGNCSCYCLMVWEEMGRMDWATLGRPCLRVTFFTNRRFIEGMGMAYLMKIGMHSLISPPWCLFQIPKKNGLAYFAYKITTIAC